MRTSLAASAPDRGSPRIGERFANRFKLLSRLRGEGVAHVYLAQDGGREVGLLVVDSARCDPRDWGVFADVVAFASGARIPGLALFHGLSAAPAPPYCLAHAPARTLERLLREEGPLPWPRALAIGERLAAILEDVETTLGIAHRALTPARCALTSDSDLQILDYGVAELEPMACPDDATHCAPERRHGPGDHRSDVYSLAAILFELIAGARPSAKLAPRLRSSVRDVPQRVDDLLARALAPDPERRFPHLATLRAALQEALEHAPKAAPVKPSARPQPVAPAPTPARSVPLSAGPASWSAPSPKPPSFTPSPAPETRPVAAETAPIVDPGLRPAPGPILGARSASVVEQRPAPVAPASAPIPSAQPAPVLDQRFAPPASASTSGARPAPVVAPASAPISAPHPAPAVAPAFATLRAPTPAAARLDPRIAPASPASTEILPPVSPVRKDIQPSGLAFIGPLPGEPPARDGTTLIDPPNLRPRAPSAPKPAQTELLPDTPAASSQPRGAVLSSLRDSLDLSPARPQHHGGASLAELRPAEPAAARSHPRGDASLANLHTPAAASHPRGDAYLANLHTPAAARSHPRGDASLANLHTPAAARSHPRGDASLTNLHTSAPPQQRQGASAPAEPALLEPALTAPPAARSSGVRASSSHAAGPVRPPAATSASDLRAPTGAPARPLLVAAIVVINLSLALAVLYLFMR